jgi:hypothetical protein
MDNSTAFQIGQIVGAGLVIVIVLGVLVFFIISLVQAIRTRRTGWIVGASVSGLPILVFFLLILIGLGIGIERGLKNTNATAAFTTATATDLLTSSMTPVPGSVIPYQVSYPSLSQWTKGDNTVNPDFDQFYHFHDAYIAVIAEGVGVGTPEKICDLAQKNLAAKASQFSVTTPTPLNIDSHSWLTYDATATVTGISVKYRFFVYADSNFTFQIICWTGPAMFDTLSPIFDRVAGSFKHPK